MSFVKGKSSPIQLADRSGRLPLSFGQQRLWSLAQMDGGNGAYNAPTALRLLGVLDRQALRQALDRIVARHEALRTSFVFVAGDIAQRIAAAAETRFALLEYDLRNRKDADQELERLVQEEASAAFDLRQGPLIRGRLIQLGEQEHALLITMHHIVSDAWSMGIFFGELSTLYAALVRGEPDGLRELSLQYADYAVWQRQWMEGETLAQQAEYWKRKLVGAPALLEIPTDRARLTQRDYPGAVVGLVLDEKLTAALKELSRRHGTTLFITLLSAWVALMARLSGLQDVVIGTPVANRGRVQIENLIGFFVNTLALRLDVSGRPTVRELLCRIKTEVVAALRHQDFPFEQVVEIVQPPRSLSNSPVFQVMFGWRPARKRECELYGLEIKPIPSNYLVSAKCDLTLSLGELGSRLVGDIEYSTSLWERETVERYVAYFCRILAEMAADDNAVVDRLMMMEDRERQKVLYDWNRTVAEYPAGKCVHDLFERQVEATPDAVAVVSENGRLSYAELNRRANRLAYSLREIGVGPDERVAICLERSQEMVVALLGVLKAGGAYVPLDPTYPTERLSYMLKDSAPVALLTERDLAGICGEAGEDVRVVYLEDGTVWADQQEENPDRWRAGPSEKHLAYVIYTSGSTGLPKGVMVEHESVVNRLVWMQREYGLDCRDAVLQKTPFGFDVSVWELFWPLMEGSCLVMARPEGHKDPGYLWETIGRDNITTVHFVPSMLQAFLERADGRGCDALLRMVCSGEALSGTLARQFLERVPGVALHNLYGPTETTIDVTAWTCAQAIKTSSIPIGRPVANTRIYILDDEGAPSPVGVTGELYIGGIQVARGYLNRAELTAERFLADPFAMAGNARMYRTGDLARWSDDGKIEYRGRNDFQVKIRGFRIELGEIEAQLSKHEGIREAVVVVREDQPGETCLVAYYTCKGIHPNDPGPDELRVHLKKRLPENMVPAAYVRIETMPLTPNGKLDRQALPAPDRFANAGRHFEAPIGQIEAAIAEIWADVLKLKQVGRNDNFLELGGNSFRAIRISNHIQTRLAEVVDATLVFDAPTVAECAAYLQQHYPTAVARFEGKDSRASEYRTDLSIDVKAVRPFRANG